MNFMQITNSYTSSIGNIESCISACIIHTTLGLHGITDLYSYSLACLHGLNLCFPCLGSI